MVLRSPEMTQAKLGLRERKKRRTREAIVEAAFELFAERGFEDTTVAEIADAAEIAPRTFFAYFPSKEDVVFADFPEMLEVAVARLHDRPTGESVIDAMRAIHLAAIEQPAPDEDRRKLQQQLIRETEALAAHNRISADASSKRSPQRSRTTSVTSSRRGWSRPPSNTAPRFGLADLGEVRPARQALGACNIGLTRIKLNDDVVEIRTNDALHLAPTTIREWEAGPDGLELLAFGTHTEGDGGLERDWWPA
jgi:AcrR family transcriptional regulator